MGRTPAQVERFMVPLAVSRARFDVEKAKQLGRKSVTLSVEVAEALVHAATLAKEETP